MSGIQTRTAKKVTLFLLNTTNPSLTMLDINLFLEERGGEPELIRESQRRRHESVEIVDEIIALYEDWKTSTSLFLFFNYGSSPPFTQPPKYVRELACQHGSQQERERGHNSI